MALPSVVFLPKTHNPNLITRRTSDESKLKGTLQNTSLVPLKTVTIIKNKKKKSENHSVLRSLKNYDNEI